MEIQKAVEMENLIFRDIIQEDFIDSYYNLTLKTVMAFKWASIFCKNAKFFMKTDDDMFVNLLALKRITVKHKHALQKSIAGRCNLVRIPVRKTSSKWYMSYENYPQKLFPLYCSGTAYVTSMNVVQKVFEVSKNIPFICLEDVYVSLCMKELRFNMTHMEGFHTGLVKPGCVYTTNKVVTSHRVTPQVLRHVWKNCTDTGAV
jgi:hypothetical protein